jgi:arsenite methyltransferase
MNEQLPAETLRAAVRHYYGEVLGSSADLRTNACCAPDALPPAIRAIVAELHPEVVERYYGCGSPIPAGLEGATVLDLGCGTGRDCYVVSKLVGPRGRVIGIDMTAAQLAIALRHRSWQAERFGMAESNVEFRLGDNADLAAAGIADASVDVVISNCVVNLAPDKGAVLREVFRVLKPGGELYFSDIYADRRIAPAHAADPVLLGECLAGALYVEDFRRLLASVGCLDARVCARHPVIPDDPVIVERLGMVNFESITWRAFRLPLEDRCEDYGQVAIYRGTLPGLPHRFALDDHHLFETGRPMLVCGNTADMVSATRFAPHFELRGNQQVHYGLFDCAPAVRPRGAVEGGGCC